VTYIKTHFFYFILFSLQLKYIGFDFKARKARTTTEKPISTRITDAAVFKYINCNKRIFRLGDVIA
jgi:hypothetical protein